MKRIIITLMAAAAASAANAQDSHFFQASLTPDIAIQSRTDRIAGISLNIWGENPQDGFTFGFVNGSTGDSSGFSMGLWNYAESYQGVQFSFLNTSSKLFTGWQNGVVNIAKEFHGVQTGTVNYAETLQGVQLGVVCVAGNNPWFSDFPDKLAPVFVFFNWSF